MRSGWRCAGCFESKARDKMKTLFKGIKKFTRFEELVLGGIFLILTFIVFAQIVLRTFKLGNLTWLDELCRVIMVDTSFVGACVALWGDHLISLTLLTDKLGRVPKNILGIITNVIGGVFCIWLGVRGWTTMTGMIATNVRTVSLGIPYWLTYLPIALSLFGMFVRFFLLAYGNLMKVIKPDWEMYPDEQKGEEA